MSFEPDVPYTHEAPTRYSDAIESVHYDEPTQTLYLEFTGYGSAVAYDKVPKAVYDLFARVGASWGRTYWSQVKGRYFGGDFYPEDLEQRAAHVTSGPHLHFEAKPAQFTNVNPSVTNVTISGTKTVNAYTVSFEVGGVAGQHVVQAGSDNDAVANVKSLLESLGLSFKLKSVTRSLG